MANNYEQGTMLPSIPNRLMAPLEAWLLGVTFNSEADGDATYFFAEDSVSSMAFVDANSGLKEIIEKSRAICPDLCAKFDDFDFSKEIELDLAQDFDWAEIMQGIIKRSNGELKQVTFECALTCSKMRPGEFGGYAIFITADHVASYGTGQFIQDMEKSVTAPAGETSLADQINSIASVLQSYGDAITTHIFSDDDLQDPDSEEYKQYQACNKEIADAEAALQAIAKKFFRQGVPA